jgi:hypothetical protein
MARLFSATQAVAGRVALKNLFLFIMVTFLLTGRLRFPLLEHSMPQGRGYRMASPDSMIRSQPGISSQTILFILCTSLIRCVMVAKHILTGFTWCCLSGMSSQSSRSVGFVEVILHTTTPWRIRLPDTRCKSSGHPAEMSLAEGYPQPNRNGLSTICPQLDGHELKTAKICVRIQHPD